MHAPKYQLVAEALRSDIISGKFSDGDVLGTEDELSKQFDISRQTLRQAIALLSKEGLVVSRRGSGTYVRRAVERQKTMTVAVITTYITDYIFPLIVRGIETTLGDRGYTMNLAATYNSVERERAILKSYLDRPVDGLIVEGTKTALPNPNIDLYNQLIERGIPLVFINGYYPELASCVHVVANDQEGGRLAAQHLIDCGHQNIAGVFKMDDMQGHQRYAGYARAMTKAGLPLKDQQVIWFTTENKYHIFSSPPVRLPAGCTAVVCYNDETAAQLTETLRTQGLEVPGDISVVGFDNSRVARMSTPPLSSIEIDFDSLGTQAASKLIELMNGLEAESIALQPTLQIQESVTQIPKGDLNHG